ncbi:MAG TPA: hypothetical protein VLG50_05435 [Candidatus Saccharimonadales bacterium]|nr:hypothetical protein [Candidatus Saccharimonadales bacterium]
MLRREVIEESQYALPQEAKIESNELIEQFKQEFPLRYQQKLLSILNAIFSHKRLKDADKQMLYHDIVNHINIYYYMNKDVFIKILDVINQPTIVNDINNATTISELPQSLKPTTIPESMSKNVKQVYFLQYRDLLVRYIDYILNVFKTS